MWKVSATAGFSKPDRAAMRNGFKQRLSIRHSGQNRVLNLERWETSASGRERDARKSGKLILQSVRRSTYRAIAEVRAYLNLSIIGWDGRDLGR